MNSDTQLKVQAYLDNELSSGDARKIADLISSDRDAQELYAALRGVKQVLCAHEPELKLQESREFYWSKIQRQLEFIERQPVVTATQRPFWIKLLAPIAGTAALFALLLSVMDSDTQVATVERDSIAAAGPLHGEVEDLAPDMSSITFRSEEQGVTVLWLTARQ